MPRILLQGFLPGKISGSEHAESSSAEGSDPQAPSPNPPEPATRNDETTCQAELISRSNGENLYSVLLPNLGISCNEGGYEQWYLSCLKSRNLCIQASNLLSLHQNQKLELTARHAEPGSRLPNMILPNKQQTHIITSRAVTCWSWDFSPATSSCKLSCRKP